ncbi:MULTISPECIES: Txe/YoeB family addiction module toxin [unclassified Flavobacterium]|uniref:Txe/YoeB family addiction module toxin n=2 Tax=Bacteroidota TaxID=976 RepID=UPI00131ECC3A|nr:MULTISPECIES: Txe/YoeB family addiction module toxin [unclassified Flavobacterium]
MEIEYTPLAKEHREYWKKSGNLAVQKKISALIEDIIKHPYEGVGKVEELKYELTGKWSRRITQEHRIVYEIKEDNVLLISRLKGHYN